MAKKPKTSHIPSNHDVGEEVIERTMEVIRLDAVDIEPIEWLWDGILQRGEVTIVGADGQSGKTTVTCELAAKLSRGAPILNRPCMLEEGGATLIINGEDSVPKNLAPMLYAMDANPENIYFDNGMSTSLRDYMGHEGGEGMEMTCDLYVQNDGIDNLLRKHPEWKIRMVIVDPTSAYLGEKNENSNADVKMFVTRFAQLAPKYNIAVVLVTHMNKALEIGAKNKLIGSVAWYHAPRAVYVIQPETDPFEVIKGIWVCIKMNGAQPPVPVRFHKESKSVTHNGVTREVGVVVWDEELTDEERRTLQLPGQVQNGAQQKVKEEKKKRGEMGEKIGIWLAEMLANGPVPVSYIKENATAMGFAWPTVHSVKRTMEITDRNLTPDELEPCYRRLGLLPETNKAWHKLVWEITG